MTYEQFEALLHRLESETIDFKSEMYLFGGSGEEQRERKAKFIKDIICLWNTPRTEAAYIVIGVKKHSDGSNELRGINDFIDDAILQEQFQDSVYPVPSIQVSPIVYQEKKFTVITIMPDPKKGPILPTKDFGGILRKHQVYHRVGSRNSLADQSAQHLIYRWFGPGEIGSSYDTPGTQWEIFIQEANNFSPYCFYFLISDRLAMDFDASELSSLGLIDWSLVVDFDPESESKGLLSLCSTTIRNRRGLHYVVKGDKPSLNPRSATYWYFARGLVGRESTLLQGEKWIDWNRSYGRVIDSFVEEMIRRIAPAPICCVAIWDKGDKARYLDTVLAAISSAAGDSLNSIIVAPIDDTGQEWLGGFVEHYNSKIVSLPLSHLCNGIKNLKMASEDREGASIPTSSGVTIDIAPDKMAWLREDLEVVTLGAGLVCPEGRQPGRDFLRGHEISWFDLGLNYDVERDVTSGLEDRIRQALLSRRPQRINLYHAPGAGGSTVARRICWNLHKRYPCFLVFRFLAGETVERISFLSALSNQPLLAIIDSGSLTDREVDALYEQVAARHLSVVMLQVLRAFDFQGSPRDRIYLGAQLSGSESLRFTHFLSREVPERAEDLEAVINSPNVYARTPFYLGLVAFEREFVGIDRYVGDRIDQLTSEYARIIAYLSFSHYYAHQPMPGPIFAELLGTPRNKPVDLRKHLSSAIDLLVKTTENEWRTAHSIIAETCIKHILRTRDGDVETWRYQLGSFAKEFITLCRGDIHTHPTISEECLNIVRRAFVYRDNAELMGTEYSSRRIFSPLMEHLPSREAKLEVYRHLIEVFPDEAHFWAHLARLLLIEFKNFDGAEEAIARALALNPEDHVIHHMCGMIQRGKVYDLIQKNSPLLEVVDAAEIATKNFTEARKWGPEDEHGYISEVQLIIRVFEYSKAMHGVEPLQVAALHDSPRWLRESLQLAEHLLAELRQLRIKDKPSHYENSCRAGLDIVYGDFNNALQLWDNLLARKDIYAPPIRRQLVWTYLARRKHDWNAMQPKEIRRIRDLLDDNLQEESGSERDLKLWIKVIRRDSNPPSLEAVIEQVAYWKSVSDSLDSVYYLYVLYALQALGGSSIEVPRMYEYLNQCRDRSRFRRQRTWSFEWLGAGPGITQLVHQDQLGDRNDEIDFWSDTHLLRRVVGVIKRIQGPHAGEIELPGGVSTFFLPGKSEHAKGADENRRVSCFIGFSYDGLRAWSVKNE